MNVQARKQFFKSLAAVKSLDVIDNIEFIYDYAKQCEKPEEIPGFKWLRRQENRGRIEVAPFRVGVEVIQDTVIFHCVYHRSIIYRQFP